MNKREYEVPQIRRVGMALLERPQENGLGYEADSYITVGAVNDVFVAVSGATSKGFVDGGSPFN